MDMEKERELEAKEREPAKDEDVEMNEQSFAELKKLAKISAEALVEETRLRTELEEKLEEVQRKTDELQDSMLRLQAEFDNYRKRTQAEIDGLFNDGMSEAIKLMLPIMDNLHLALNAAQEAEDENIAKGISLCIDQFMDTFGKKGLEEIPAEGEDFDPNLHEAVMQQPCDDSEKSGKIAEVMKKGYIFKDKVLRYSMVQVYC